MMLREALEQQAAILRRIGQPALMERFVLRRGQHYTGRARPKGTRRGTPKECFRNATLLVLRSPTSVAYCEGYVFRPELPLPIHHAWGVRDGHVIDTTLTDPQACEYIGVLMPLDVLRSELSRNGVYGLLDTGRGLNVAVVRQLDPELWSMVEGERVPA